MPIDPNKEHHAVHPLSFGNQSQFEVLENAGITVHVGVMSDEVEKLNRPFIKWITLGIPWVIAKVAQTADG